MFEKSGVVMTPSVREVLEREKQTIENVTSGLEKAWGGKFVHSALKGTDMYMMETKDVVCRIGGAPSIGETRIVIIKSNTNVVVYTGILRDDVNYYVRVLKANKSRNIIKKKSMVL